MDYRTLPKIELHRHLEGNFSPRVLYHMAQKNHLSFPRDYEEFKAKLQFPKDSPPDFFLFLSKFYNTWYKSLDDVHEVVYTSMKEMALDDNLAYLELRFNPIHYAIHCGFDPVDTLNTVLSALRQAVDERGIFARYLITFNRGFQKQEEMKGLLTRFQKEADLTGVVGLDLAGDEVNFPPELFTDFFQYAHAQGFKATFHAGEVSSPEQIRCAVMDNQALRIGHGVSLIQDPSLLQQMKDKEVTFEMCPISNYQTGAWADTPNHPIKRLLREGLKVTLNSDDPTVQNSELYDEYKVAHEKMGLTLDELARLNHNSIDGCFLSDQEKQKLRRDFDAEWKKAVQ